MDQSRRALLKAAAATAALGPAVRWAGAADKAPTLRLARQVGITTSSLSRHLVANPGKGQFSLIDAPGVLRDELDMHVIDLNTSSLASYDADYLDRCRDAAEQAGCVFTNLKLNQRNLDMNSPDKSIREQALAEYRRSIDAAARLGCRWARPLPSSERPDMQIHVDSYRRLADHAAERGIQMLVENFGWMDSDADSVPHLIQAIDRNVAASPDTGNWANDEVRYAGLAKIFPLAVTCDFKARKLGPAGEHPLYDLKRCFDVGWQAGFRGPWCLEHAHPDRDVLFRELGLLRDMLHAWMRESSQVTIVTLGDSITKGWRSGVTKEQTFSALLQESLLEGGFGAQVVNVGIGGERTDQALKRLDRDVIAKKPTLVTIMYGTNDSYVDQGKRQSRITVRAYRDNLRELVRQLRAARIKPVLMTAPRWGDAAGKNGVGEHPNERLSQYVAACREVAGELDVPLVDHFENWNRAANEGTDVGNWTTDQCHPNPEGHRLIGAQMLPIVVAALESADAAGESTSGER